MKQLRVEVADSFPKREKGLMHRKKLSSGNGMLFKFPYINRLSFWMKNTYVPLDIAFIDDDGMILQIKPMTPMSTKAVVSDFPCRYALEVNRGWFDNNNIREGSTVLGEGITHKKGVAIKVKTAQVMDAPPIVPLEEEVDPMNPQAPQAQPPQTEQLPGETVLEQRDPDVRLNITIKELIEDADFKGLSLSLIYQIKERPGKPQLVLPPKKISGPFNFEPDEFGDEDAIVKCWDEQDAEWKSFLIDNIVSIDYFGEGNVEENVENVEG
jgi:uncharacterized protein